MSNYLRGRARRASCPGGGGLEEGGHKPRNTGGSNCGGESKDMDFNPYSLRPKGMQPCQPILEF